MSAIATIKLFIDGKLIESQAKQWRDVVNPATQAVLARVPLTTVDEVNAAVAAAKRAFASWRYTPIGVRARIFLRYQQLIREHLKELAAILTAEQGKTLADAEGDIFRGWRSSSTPPTSAPCSWASWPTTSPTASTRTRCSSRSACARASRPSTFRR